MNIVHDREIEALAAVARALKGLQTEEVERILKFAADRHGVDLGRVVPTPLYVRWHYHEPWDNSKQTWGATSGDPVVRWQSSHTCALPGLAYSSFGN